MHKLFLVAFAVLMGVTSANATTYTWTGSCSFGCSAFESFMLNLPEASGGKQFSAGIANAMSYGAYSDPDPNAYSFTFSPTSISGRFYDGVQVSTLSGQAATYLYQRDFFYFSFARDGSARGWDEHHDEYYTANNVLISLTTTIIELFAATGSWDVSPFPPRTTPVPLPPSAFFLAGSLVLLVLKQRRRTSAL